MNYIRHMFRVLQLDTGVYKEFEGTNLPLRDCMIHVIALGLIYGLFTVHYAKAMLAQTDAAASFNPVMILLVGVSLAFIMHGGTALFVWVFCRGIGGCPQFVPPYLNIGIASIALWPLAPAVSRMQVGSAGPVVTGLCVFLALYGLFVIFAAVKAVSNLSNLKMTIAAVATVIYIGCFLYLWI